MTEEPIQDFITQRIKNVGYNSINFDLALTKEDGLWKVLVARIIFDIVTPQGQQTVLKKDNFVIEQYHLSSAGCGIYMPIYDASIADCNFNGNHLTLKIDIDATRTKIETLSVGIIANGRTQEYSRKHNLQATSMEIDVGFVPAYAI